MAKAFKCDVCKGYDIGSPYAVSIIPPLSSARVLNFDVCEKCFIAMNKALKEERGGSMPEFKELI